MSLTPDQMYALLPAVYRVRDAENGLPLQALIQVIASQTAVVEDNLLQLYDDEFIETCASWVIPYIGDLVGFNPVYEIGAAAVGRRAEVANTIGYRRRKGTILALEQVAMDVSGMPALAVEYFRRLVTSESMRHIRAKHTATVDLRRGSGLARQNSPFDTLNHIVDVRRIAPRNRVSADPDPTPLNIALHGGGKYNIPDVGVCLWRWKPYQVTNAPAFVVDSHRFMFNPLGADMPLFNFPPPRDSFSRLTTRMDVSQPIGRRELFDDLASFYPSSVQLIADGVAVDASQICCRDLSDKPGGDWGCAPAGKIAIDPVCGRILYAAGTVPPAQLVVNYSYGFPADIGGGPYDRSANLPSFTQAAFPFQATVGSAQTPTLADAVAAWNTEPVSAGVIVLPDFTTLDIDLRGAGAINVPSGTSLWIVSAQSGGTPIPAGTRALLRGNIEVHGTGQLLINGAWISGSVSVSDAASVQFSDCTLVPGVSLTRTGLPVQPGEPSVVAPTPGAAVSLLRTISGPLAIAEGALTRICSSIVDASSRCSVAYSAPDGAAEAADLHIEDSTVIGKVHTRTMELASNTIFLARLPKYDPWKAAVWCSRKQSGCMRFCFVPSGSITPQQYRCLPGGAAVSEAALRPQFVTLQYGSASYALLSGNVPWAVWTGSDNGSQMGVYKLIEETEGVRNVQLRAPEFLPFNMEAGVFLEPSAPVVIAPTALGYGYGAARADPCADVDEDELWYVGVGAHLV